MSRCAHVAPIGPGRQRSRPGSSGVRPDVSSVVDPACDVEVSSPRCRPENMVHQTISTSSNRAPSASRISSSTRWFSVGWRRLAGILGGLCVAATAWAQAPASVARWIPANWSELPGFEADALHEAWNAWVRSCERPAVPFAALCREVRPLSLASDAERRRWMLDRLQPFRLQAADGAAQGLLTGYFEPELEASRDRSPAFAVPLYRPPAGLGQRRP